MGVDEAEGEPAAPLLGDDRLAEGGKEIEEPLLLELLRRTDGQACHPAPLRQLQTLRPLGTGPPGKDFGRHPTPAQFLAHRADVDVQAAVFAGAKRRDR